MHPKLIRKTKNIAFYCSSIARGGLEMNLVRYASWMSELEWRVKVFCVAGSPIHALAAKAQLEIVLIRRNKKYFNITGAFRIARLFEKEEIDLCWLRDTRDFQILGLAKRISNRPFKLLYQQAMQFGVSKKDLIHTMRFQPVDAWVSTLNFLAEQVRTQTKFPQAKIHVIPLGVDEIPLKKELRSKSTIRKEAGIPHDTHLVGIIGRIDPLKGQHIAIEAIALLHQRGIQAHLLIVGEATLHEGNTYYEKIKHLVEKNNLKSFVHFKPYTENVGAFYRMIDTFVLCSKGETFGTVTIEAMACAVPVIATNSSGSPEILAHGECGLLFAPDDSAALSGCIERYMQEPSLGAEMANKARQKFDLEYSKIVSTKRMDSLMRDLLAPLK
jgi:D-inositol-3-phosphate glycosyltransferase